MPTPDATRKRGSMSADRTTLDPAAKDFVKNKAKAKKGRKRVKKPLAFDKFRKSK
jgi:hypothetical protein